MKQPGDSKTYKIDPAMLKYWVTRDKCIACKHVIKNEYHLMNYGSDHKWPSAKWMFHYESAHGWPHELTFNWVVKSLYTGLLQEHPYLEVVKL